MAPSSSGQDTGLSRREQGFDSPWGHHEYIQGLSEFSLGPFLFIGDLVRGLFVQNALKRSSHFPAYVYIFLLSKDS